VTRDARDEGNLPRPAATRFDLLLVFLLLAPVATHAGAAPWEEDGSSLDGRDPTRGFLKLRAGLPVVLEEGVFVDAGLTARQGSQLEALVGILRGRRVSPRFSVGPGLLADLERGGDARLRLGSLVGWYAFEGPDAAERVALARRNPLVETAYLAFAPQPPPTDLPPETPDFSELQAYVGPSPDGLGIGEAARWPGGGGARVRVVDVEYGWDPEHEDLGATRDIETSGYESGMYEFHGNSVLGQLFAGDDGYGVTGMIPDAEPIVVFPFGVSDRDYDVADAILRALALLQPGDVILVEQQSWARGNYCPVEVDPGVFDAIALATANGVVVVEPSGNGGQDLDDPAWGGIFDRDVRDSGAILVGGGASPLSPFAPRSWIRSGGSCYGTRVDVQAWYDAIVTTTNGEYDGYYADLFFADEDPRQAYTASFGGTSGASPMITAIVGILQSVLIEAGEAPLSPGALRALLSGTVMPQPETDSHAIGGQPDLRVALRSVLSW
jgi:hypothetical protein